VLGGTLTIARDRSAQLTANPLSVDTQDTAATYTSVLVPSGLTSSNYNISFVNGNYTIVPVGQLLVKVADTSATYGSTPTYTLTAAGYLSSATANSVTTYTVNDLLTAGQASVSGNQVTVTDGSNTVGSFNLGASNPSLSSSGTLKVGTYSVGATSITTNSGNFSNTINVVGAYEVTPKTVTASATNVTKTYDGNTTVLTGYNLAPVGLVSGTVSGSSVTDTVTLSGVGTYANKNVTGAADKTYTWSTAATRPPPPTPPATAKLPHAH
jgi:hypothetical protein